MADWLHYQIIWQKKERQEMCLPETVPKCYEDICCTKKVNDGHKAKMCQLNLKT